MTRPAPVAQSVLGAVALLAAGWLGTVTAAASPTLALDGEAVQSGLLVGRTDPAAEVRVNGTHTRLSPEGVFLIGLDRDASGEISIDVRGEDGQRIVRRVPVKTRAYDIQRIDGLAERSVTPKAEDVARINADAESLRRARGRDTPELALLAGFVWPLDGPISGVFGSQRVLNGNPRQPHRGIDIAAPQGVPVRAMAGGTVSLVAPDMFFTGKTVAIDHGHGLSSVYAHLQSIAVKSGDRIEAGRVIGAVGQTGRATGPHLHWGVSLFDAFLDPVLLARHPALKAGVAAAPSR